MTDLPSLIAFGSLTTWPSATELEQLRHTLSQHEHLRPVQEALLRLPELWETLVASDKRLESIPGQAAGKQLAAWILSKQVIDQGQNILCLPLTILRHLCEYGTYIKQTSRHSTILGHVNKAGGIQGFCAGLLSALAVAGSKDEEELGRHGALSIRLAFAIGAYVDLDSWENKATNCLALRWKAADGFGTVQTLLQKHSLDSNPAYVSVLRDTNDATVTVPSSALTTISAAFIHAGVSVLDTGLAGRYHCRNYQGVPEKILQSCQHHGGIQFGVQNVVRSNVDGEILLHENAVVMTGLRDILLEQSNWHLAISKARATVDGTAYVLAFGSDAIPQSIFKDAKVRILKPTKHDGKEGIDGHFEKYISEEERQRKENMARYPADSIAIIGLSCKLPGANSPEAFWQLLTSGTVMVKPVPVNRWPEASVPRGKTQKFWGNFMDGIDEFDHRFFKKAPREAASMDPQQRLLLQGAYEAMESAGYFGTGADRRDTNIGCYLGLCAIDYDANVASHPPNAFSTMGTLRAFLSGKISHFFGWDGPSLTLDTACSSSAVAIHTACRAIQAGEISQALAGGVSLFTTPYLYENLSAAHFLSPTGATKPFDANADGYCRGEGLGLVVLKKLSAAVADGDNVLAVIAGSAVNQNDNCVPITVPHVRSQGKLYRHVAEMAGVLPHQVSFVEAHGTGTPVGDPIEMDSIRNVFGGSERQHPLVISSVKGNIGHLEGASGVAGLIKAVLQIETRTAARQASFQSLNPKIPPLHVDKMTIPTSNIALQDDFIVGCVNNYGAAGSNSTLMIMEPPRKPVSASALIAPSKYPILIAANSKASLVAYCQVLSQYCQQKFSQIQKQNLLGSIAFHLGQRQNQSLPHVLMTTASDLSDLEAQLQRQLVESTAAIESRPSCPPLVLVFGGQVRDYVGLSKPFWNHSVLLRFHLDRCNDILISMGYVGLYPAIFQHEPISDVVILHSAVFSLQYASAQAWLDSGLVVNAVVGHSLGQLTALSVSGILSLEDGLRLVTGRASLMKKYWGAEAGSMIAVEADLATISRLPHFPELEIACYNGPSSHVLVGDSISVDAFQEALLEERLQFKRLAVTNGFHSRFTEPLIEPLQKLATGLHFHKPIIPIETCSDGASWLEPTAELIAQHTREPVFFSQAVRRLAHTRGACTWLEAGSDSSVTSMVRRALGSESFQHTFQSISLSKPAALDTLVDATMLLWRKGHSLQFWDFHPFQRQQYEALRLPSYQFEKNKHWLELIPPAPTPAVEASDTMTKTAPEIPQLVRLITEDAQGAIFKIDPQCEEYQRLVAGHVVAGSPLCPATVYMEIAARALKLLFPVKMASLMGFSDLRIDSPLGMALDQTLTMTLRLRSGRDHCWDFSVASQQKGTASVNQVSHAVGVVEVPIESAIIDLEFARFERLTGPDAIEALYQDPESESIRGPLLYKLFSRVVEYGEPYRGLKSVAARNRCAAGTVVFQPEHADETVASLTRPTTLDSFMQVAGIHANSIYPCPENEVYVFTKLDRLQFGAEFMTTPPSSWIIFSNLTPVGSKELANDIFVFDSRSKRLVVLILGARFHNVRLTSLTKVLSRVNIGASQGDHVHAHSESMLQPSESISISPSQLPVLPGPVPTPGSAPKGTSSVNASAAQDAYTSIFNDICLLFERVADVPRASVKGHMSVEDLGMDSLMMLEVISELSTQFSLDIPIHDMVELSDVDSLVSYLQKRGCGQHESSLLTSSSATSSVASSTSSFSPTPASTEPSSCSPIRPSSPRENSSDVIQQQQINQLTKLLQEHLELESPPSLGANLGDLGLDSLLAIELASDIEKLLSVSVDLYQLDDKSTFRDLLHLAGLNHGSIANTNNSTSHDANRANILGHLPNPSAQIPQAVSPTTGLSDVHEAFEAVRLTFDSISQEEGFTDFWSAVYPDQKRLVLSYITEAFKQLGCDLASLPANTSLPKLAVLDKHKHLLERLHKILADGGYIGGQEFSGYKRSSKPLELAASQVLLKEVIAKFPLHASEHRLLDVTGSQLADCLTGKANPLSLLFANKTNRQVLADVYDLAPMCRAATRLLANFLLRALSSSNKNETFHILEVGGGTGGTSKFLVEFLTRSGVNFTYTFTDISSALVSGVKKSFAGYDCMRYATLDCDEPPRPEFIGKFHALVSTNCIHATHNATTSLANIRQMLRPDNGFLALVEFTNGMYWFDLVYGLLDGWWLFGDGRRHALGDISFWERSLLAAGYKSVNWTSGDTPEAKTLQLICGFNSAASGDKQKHGRQESPLLKRGGVPVETLVWKQVDDLELSADVYYPTEVEKDTALKRPIALLFHGGGHVLFTRKDINIKHIKTLLERGFLPVSVDYRLCPEVNLAEGPVTDACDALVWARQKLPQLKLERTDIRVDGDRVVAVGWSSGGHLAMTLAYSSKANNIPPPEAVLAFYCPSNLEDEWWKHPIYPKFIQESPSMEYDLLEGVGEKPISGYIPNTPLGTPMTLKDPRWRIIIHYNWKAQLVPVLVGGLPSKSKASAGNLNADSWKSLPMPKLEEIQAVSPYAQIVQGHYHTPTFMVHGDRDDLIPWQQTRDTIEALRKQGIEAGFAIPTDAGHAFDLWSSEDPKGTGWAAMIEGYDFICRYV